MGTGKTGGIVLLGWLLASQVAQAELTHLYTFNDGTAADSVGNAHGQLLGSAAVDAAGVLHLPGGPDDFVSLDGPAIGIQNYTDATFEAWFNSQQLLNWQRGFDFGDRTVPNSQQGYVYYTPQSGAGVGLGVYATFGNRTEAPHGSLSANLPYHLAMVIDDAANGGANVLQVYLNGSLQTTVPHNKSLANVSDTFAYLGKSLVAVDPNFNGTMDEFRIYDHALDAQEVAASFAAGPTPQSELRLLVNTVTGRVQLIAEGQAAIAFDYYKLSSAAGALDPVRWSSLEDQQLDAVGPGAGQSWEEGPLADESELIELYLAGASTIDEQTIDLGHAFNPAVLGPGNAGDLVFEYSQQRSPLLRTGQVQYVTPDPLSGDYNQDGKVDAADYTVWRDTLGSTTVLTADGDGNGVVDQADYLIWQWTFGKAPAAATTTAVPEPAAWLLLATGIAAGWLRKRMTAPPRHRRA